MSTSGADFEGVWREHRASLWRVAWLIVGDRDQADDVVSAAFARSLHGWGDRSVDNPQAYLRRAVVNEATDGFRRRSRDRRWLTRHTGDGRGAPQLDEAAADGADLRAALRRLSIDHRTVIVLRYWADLSEQATADALSISVGTVKSRTSRALHALAADLGADFRTTRDEEVTDV